MLGSENDNNIGTDVHQILHPHLNHAVGSAAPHSIDTSSNMQIAVKAAAPASADLTTSALIAAKAEASTLRLRGLRSRPAYRCGCVEAARAAVPACI